MNLEDAKILAELYIEQHLSKQNYGATKPWTFAWIDHKTTYGMCHYRKREIQLSRVLTEVVSEAEVEDTILHEIAHALTPGCGHGRMWKMMARALGANPKSTRAFTEEEKQDMVVHYKWVMILKDEPDRIIKGYHRKPNASMFESLPERYLRGRKAETKGRLMLVPVDEYKRMQKDDS
jgi:predicted SprT family Zn-dependent metalloprotease